MSNSGLPRRLHAGADLAHRLIPVPAREVDMIPGLGSAAPALPLQLGGLLGEPLGQALAVIVAIAVVVLVGRIVLKVAWRLVTIAAVVIGALLVLSFFGINVL